MTSRKKLALAAVALALGACATPPAGPSVMVLPGNGKSFEAFRADDELCRGYAGQQLGTNPERAANERAVAGAAVGTGVGAAAGALIGAATHEAGPGAAIGSGVGLLLGSAGGAAHGQRSGRPLRRPESASRS